MDRDAVVARQEDRFGGIKIGSFFGWLTATGVAALLTALLAAAGAAIALANNATATEIAGQATAATDTAETVGLVGGIALLVILFVAYCCGGYVAGRMARFNGTKQGLAVWLWAVVIAIVTAILGAVAGTQYDVLARLNPPRIPVNEGSLTTGGIIAIVAVALASARLGGRAGMHYHRKVDQVGLAASPPDDVSIATAGRADQARIRGTLHVPRHPPRLQQVNMLHPNRCSTTTTTGIGHFSSTRWKGC